GGSVGDGGAGVDDGGSVVERDAGTGVRDDGGVDDAGEPPAPCLEPAPLDAPCAPSHEGLVACWDFEDVVSSGGTSILVPDVVGGFSAMGSGRIVDSLHGSGYDPNLSGYLALSAPPAIAADGPMSVDAWVFARSLPVDTGTPARNVVYDSNAQFGLMLHSTGMACAAGTATDPTFRVITEGFPTGRWVHVTCSLSDDGAGLVVYVDGAEAARAVHSGTLLSPNAPIYIGANSPTGTEQFDGVIDELRVFRARRSAVDACWAAQP
ncbi:MAG: LamG domain-containing protein, partial [Deltaproteobacteria bacterium]|nr:LamG domain-containing protein [Deltaproteobacteria bacterium]